MDDFSKPKIVYREISTEMEACIAPTNWMINNKLYMITAKDSEINYLCDFLNSRLFTRAILIKANFGGGKGIDFLGDVKLPLMSSLYLELSSYEQKQKYFCEIFGLTIAESKFILTE